MQRESEKSQAQQQRWDERHIADLMSLGLVSCFWKGMEGRAQTVLESPSIYNVANWLSMGLLDLGKGAINPEKPLSLEHWLDSLGFASALYGMYETGKRAVALRKSIPARKPEAGQDTPPIDGENRLPNRTSEEYPLYRQKANIGKYAKLKEPMTIEHVRKVCEDGGIDYSGIKIKIRHDPELVESGFLGYTHPGGRIVELYPDAFENRETLLKTLGHERIHVMQNKLYGPPQDSILCGLFENAATQSEDSWWSYYKSINGGK